MSKLSHSSEEFMDKIERNSDKYFDVDHCQCDACIGGDIHASDCAVHNMPAYPNGSCDCALSRSVISTEMVDRFLSWQLPKGFSPDCGISFDGRGKDAMGYEKQWPVGTNLLSADQAREMLEYVVAPTLAYEKLLLSNAEKELAGLRESAAKALRAIEYILETTIPYREDSSSTISDKAIALANEAIKDLKK